jgi:hypothetical protein
VRRRASPERGSTSCSTVGTWTSPTPANFVNGLLDGGQPLSYGYPVSYFFYDDARYLRRMRSAYRLRGKARANAFRDLVADMMRESPPGAVYLTRAWSWPAQFFSERIDPACVVLRPQDGGYADRALPAWVRELVRLTFPEAVVVVGRESK